jgi:membrane-associated phospholipid phosphatase
MSRSTAGRRDDVDQSPIQGQARVLDEGWQAQVRYAAGRLVGGGILVYAFLAALGLLLTRVVEHGAVTDADRRVSLWWAQHRTPGLNGWTHVASMMSDTITAIAATVVIVLVLALWLRRWREPIAVVLSISGELFIFLLVTATVHRQRPTVPHLDPAPPTSSFPSGHTGAAVALYVGLAVILLTLSRGWNRRWPGAVLAVLLCAVPVVVGLSRMYRGMHFLTDVLAGAVAGGLWMAIVMATLLRDRPRNRSRNRA